MVFIVLTWAIIAAAVVSDLKTRTLPVTMIFLLFALAVTRTSIMMYGDRAFPKAALLSLAPGIALLLLSRLTGAIGEGDALFMIAVGPLTGALTLLYSLMLAFFISALCAVVLLTLKKVKRGSEMPFMPFFAAGLGVVSFVFA